MSPAEAIQSLIDNNWPQQKIAEKVETTQATISKIRAGTNTNYELGLRLVALGRRYGKRVSRSNT